MAGYLGYLDYVIELRGLVLDAAPIITWFVSMVGLAADLGLSSKARATHLAPDIDATV
ncbi:MAG: hypothetical protein ACK4P3_05145 [Fimbriimonadaceae bacterium]